MSMILIVNLKFKYMKRKTTFFATALLAVGSVFSQTLPDGMVSLLPAGVTANISNATIGTKQKDLVVAGNKTQGYLAFFAATDATNGEELWVTDGTTAGTRLVKDIRTGSTGSSINYLTRFNDKVVFGADNGTDGEELWISDGTTNGTYMISNIHTTGASVPRGFTQLNETQFVFVAKNANSGTQSYLYVSNGTEIGTQLIYECDAKFPGTATTTSYVTPYCRVGRKVYFKADYKVNSIGEELWMTDGTTDGTILVKNINTNASTGASLDHFVNFYNEKLFFRGTNYNTNGAEPWASDGTEAGTYMIKDSNIGTGSGGISTPGVKPYNGKIYFRGYDSAKGTELACTNLEQDSHTVFDINLTSPTATNNSAPDTGVEFDGVLFFDADAKGVVGIEPHYCDGNSVTLHTDRAAGTPNFFMRDQVVVSGSLYWYNGGGPNTSADYFQLFRLNSKNDVIERVTTLYTDNQNHNRFHSLRNLGGELLVASYPVVSNVTSPTTNSLYAYHYRKPTFNPLTDTEDLEIEYRTRAEMLLPVNISSNATDAAIVGSTSNIEVSGVGTTFNITNHKTVNDISVNAGSKLNFTADKTLTVTGDLLLKADQTNSFSANIGSGTLAVMGAIKYLRTIDDQKWYFVSFPSDVTIADITATNTTLGILGTDWFIKYYDGAQRGISGIGNNWKSIIAQDVIATPALKLNKYQGYIVGLKTGKPITELSFPLVKADISTETTRIVTVAANTGAAATTNHGWNLIGQPYLSKFTANSATGAFNIYISDGTSTYSPYSKSNAPDLNPMSAYFVQASSTLANDGISFNTLGRQSVRSLVNNDLSDEVQLNLTSSTGIDYALLTMDNNLSNDYEIGYDLEKWIGTGTNKPQVYTQLNGLNYAFNTLPMNSVSNLPIGIYTKNGGSISFSANAVKAPGLTNLLLADNSTNPATVTDLLLSDYNFTADAGTNNDRFTITAQHVSTENVIETQKGEPNLTLNNSVLKIQNNAANAIVLIYDAMGRIIANKTVNNSFVEVKLPAIGMYTVRFETGAKNWAKKIINQN